jgi:SPP1 gp7 family putative phage head morphogenesis protein
MIPPIHEVFDKHREAEIFARIYLPYFVFGFHQGRENVIGRSRKRGFTDFVRETLRRKAFDHAALAVGATSRRLQSIFQDAIDEGEGVGPLAKNIRDMFGVASRTRSLRIARTELTDVINDGSNQTLRDEGYQEKEWSTVIDGQERPSHNAANGQTVGIHDLFRVGGESARYPGDENLPPGERISCRCALVGAGMTDQQKRYVGRRFLHIHGTLERKFMLQLRRAFLAQRDRVLSHFPS